MNIEDSIKILKEFNKIKINSYVMQFVNISYPDLQEAIETLLTAYEKEKEANKRLDKEAQGYLEELAGDGSMNIRRIQELEAELEKEKEENMSYYYHIQGLEDDIRMHYISTYKIEKEIKKIKDSNTYGCEEWNDRDVVELLENLISKEE